MWPRLLIGGLIYAAATLPWTSQRLPRFFLPALAAGGAILIVGALVRAVVRLARPHRPNRRADATAVLVNAVATLVFVLSPAARLAGSTVGGSSGAPRMLAAFGDWRGSEGYPRLSPHRGVDIAARLGSDVLAAADGRVVVARDNNDACGLIVVIVHDPHGYRTVYCHLVEFAVTPGQHVSRGQRIGAVGTTGQRAWPGYEHVHLELQRGSNPQDLEDPAARFAGCFDGAMVYPAERLLLTYPVRC